MNALSKALAMVKTPAGVVAVLVAGAVGGFGAVALSSSAPSPASVVVRQVADTSTPTATVAPVVVPTTAAPAPVQSTQAPAPVVAPKLETIVPAQTSSPTPAPQPIKTNPGNSGTPAPPGGIILDPYATQPTPSATN